MVLWLLLVQEQMTSFSLQYTPAKPSLHNQRVPRFCAKQIVKFSYDKTSISDTRTDSEA